jgi:hypothetical protein
MNRTTPGLVSIGMRTPLTVSIVLASMLAPAVLAGGPGKATGPASRPPRSACEIDQQLVSHTPWTLALPTDLPASFSLTLPIGQGLEVLELQKFSNRSDAYQVLVDVGGGRLEPAQAPAIRTYRGIVAARPGTLVSGSILPNGFTGIVRLEDGDTWVIQPMADFCEALAAPGAHVIFHASDAIADGRGCGIGQPGFEQYSQRGERLLGEGGTAGTTPSQVEVGCETDYEFFQKNGSNVNNTVNDIETVMNNVNAVYDRDLNITHEIGTIVVRSAVDDPYVTTTIDGRLNEFSAKWGTAPESGIFRDISHMFSGYAFSGGAIGLAYLGAVCTGANSIQYGVVESRYTTQANFRTSLSAHELGHNWDATHCDSDGSANCNIMCSANGACGGISGTNLRFNTRTQNEVGAYLAAVNCDFTRPEAQVLPFVDNFASTTFSNDRWTYRDGVQINTSAAGEPSAPNSMNLNSSGPNAYDDDEVRSNFIKLAGITAPVAVYWVNRSGVESGETLVVEYLNNALDWVVLNTLTSDGTNPTSFTRYEHLLPSNARHDKFRLRFRVDGNETNDNWWVDDVSVSVGTVPAPANDECSGAITVAQGTTNFDASTATNSALAIPSSCSANAAVTMSKDLWYRYVSDCDGTLTVSTCDLVQYDTKLVVYAASAACPTSATPIAACSDNELGCANAASSVRVSTVPGAIHYIRVGGVDGGGPGAFDVACQPRCVGDFNDDRNVDGIDLGVLLSLWGSSASSGGDLNNDGVIDGIDLGILLSRWGLGCP